MSTYETHEAAIIDALASFGVNWSPAKRAKAILENLKCVRPSATVAEPPITKSYDPSEANQWDWFCEKCGTRYPEYHNGCVTCTRAGLAFSILNRRAVQESCLHDGWRSESGGPLACIDCGVLFRDLAKCKVKRSDDFDWKAFHPPMYISLTDLAKYARHMDNCAFLEMWGEGHKFRRPQPCTCGLAEAMEVRNTNRPFTLGK